MPIAEQFDFDPVALRRKYDEERDKRLALRPEGTAQFRQLTGELEHYAEDPYTPVEERARPARPARCRRHRWRVRAGCRSPRG